jgi:hypothetical protein
MIIFAKNRKKSFGSPILTNYPKIINDFHNFDEVFDPEVDILES